ncbi:hypothetical protein Tcan_04626 [Toxocara canis]|uniref:Uncharacterized protein n=1 Tax=Toxocara canis TaxID=6265 RepID=A0A0B2VGA2_TOXCA|nr:hypothetical protein Tcan_04626 [Toxocara canis]
MMANSSEASRKMGGGAAIYGPLLHILKFFAPQLDQQLVMAREAVNNNRSNFKRWAKIISLWIIGLLILYRCIILTINQRSAMADMILMGLNANQLTVSLLALLGYLFICYCQYDGFLTSFPQHVESATRLKALKSAEAGGDYLRPWHVFWLISPVAILALIGAAEVELYRRQSHLEEENIVRGILQYPNILLFAPNAFILLWSVVSLISSIALLSLLHKTVVNELSYFNNEIIEAATNGHLQHVDLLSNYVSRHIDILDICHTFNERISVFVSLWIILAGFGIICNVVNLFASDGNWPIACLSVVLIAFWTLHSGAIIGNCFSLIAQIQRTRHLVLYEKSIWHNANEKVYLLVIGMAKRIEEFHHLQLAGIATIKPRLFAFFIVLLSTGLVLLTQNRLLSLMNDGAYEKNFLNTTIQ